MAIGFIKADNLENVEIYNLYADIVNCFNEHGIDIQPYMAIRDEDGIEILSVNIDEIDRNPPNEYRKFLWENRIWDDEVDGIVKLLHDKFIKDENGFTEKPNISTCWDYEKRDVEYCVSYMAPHIPFEEDQHPIESQFRTGQISVTPYVVEFIKDYPFYCMKNIMGVLAIQNLWNMIEKDEINEFQACICSKLFCRSGEVMHSNRLMYGDGKEEIKEMLEGMKG